MEGRVKMTENTRLVSALRSPHSGGGWHTDTPQTRWRQADGPPVREDSELKGEGV